MTSPDELPISEDERALRASVERHFAVRAADEPPTPGWPDPWRDRDAPDEAYERVTRPERLEIAVRRADAWVGTLSDAGLIESIEAADPMSVWRDARSSASGVDSRASVVRPVAAGATPLVLVTHRFTLPEGQAATQIVGAGVPAVVVEEPDCFCDACDSGSDDLIRWYDEQILEIVGGDFCFIDGPGIEIRAGRSGWRSSGEGRPSGLRRRWTREDTERAIAQARAGTSMFPTLVADVTWWRS